MAYRIGRNETGEAGLRRAIAEQLAAAADLLRSAGEAGRDHAIHQARRCLKRVRSALRLAGPELWTAPRKAARKLSPFRDAAALVEALAELRRRYPRRHVSAFRLLHRDLCERKRELEIREDVGDVIRKVVGRLARMELTVSLPLKLNPARSHRARKQAMTRAAQHPTPENLHTLRKRVRDCRLQSQLLGRTDPEASWPALDARLGEDHNLWLLRRFATGYPGILRLIDERRTALRDAIFGPSN